MLNPQWTSLRWHRDLHRDSRVGTDCWQRWALPECEGLRRLKDLLAAVDRLSRRCFEWMRLRVEDI